MDDLDEVDGGSGLECRFQDEAVDGCTPADFRFGCRLLLVVGMAKIRQSQVSKVSFNLVK